MTHEREHKFAVRGLGKQQSAPLKMAEPLHRQGPKGSSTGQSIRTFHKSYINEVREICLYYVKKCSGKYQDNEAAARYVHQMAQEVISQLAGVAEEVRRTQGEPEVFQALLDEWNANFPPSLGRLGSPKNIAVLVEKQSKELVELREALEQERSSREQDLSDMLNSMDAQLQAYQSSVISERNQQMMLDKQKEERYENTIKSMRSSHAKEIDRLEARRKKDSNKMKTEYEHMQQESESLVRELKDQIETAGKHNDRVVSTMERRSKRKIIRLTKKLEKGRDKYASMKALMKEEYAVSMTTDATSTINNSDTESEGSIETQDTEFDYGGQNNSMGGKDSNSSESAEDTNNAEVALELMNMKTLEEYNALYRKFSMVQTGLLAMREEVRSKTTLAEECSNRLGENLLEMELLKADLNSYMEKLYELQVLNETLRKALGARLDPALDPGDFSAIIAQTVREFKQSDLNHTPHFLGPDDTKGFYNSHPKLTPYRNKTAGHF